MRRTIIPTLAAIASIAVCALPASALGESAASPAWTISVTPMPTNFAPGGQGEFLVLTTNVGGAPTDTSEPSVVRLELQSGIKALSVSATNNGAVATPPACEVIDPQTASCKTEHAVGPGRSLLVEVKAEAGTAGSHEAKAQVSGGGVGGQITTTMLTQVQNQALPFGFLPGFAAPADNPDGSPPVQAGSHPYQQTVRFGFPTENLGAGLNSDGHLRDVAVELPRGLLGNPAATQVLCTEAELSGAEGCPEGSQVGVADVTTFVGEEGHDGIATSNLYNMLPPPGYPAEIATDVAGVGIFAHTLASVRSGDDYRARAELRDIIAFGRQPIFNIQAQLWGDPTGEAHDGIRGECGKAGGLCKPKLRTEVPFLTMPGDCPGKRLGFEAFADSWEEPAPEYEEREALYESADLEGNPVQVEGCGSLDFKPSIESRPTTGAAESSAGLEFHLHQPQQDPSPEPLSGQATAILKDATVTFPAGMQVNPSQAKGLKACSEEQIGFEGEEEGRLRFSEEPQRCPDAAKLGTAEARSPLLVERDPLTHEAQIDPQTGKPKQEPLEGSIYLAKPFANPFGSLIAVYIVVEDQRTGILAKLAGVGKLDPDTGQITAHVKESPEVPIEDVHVSLFGGDRGALITPPACGTYTTHAALVPWSHPQGEALDAQDSFSVDKAPDGGGCAALANSPRLEAGTLSPAAGQYSPLVFELSREDGSERFGRVEATLPPGLTAKLAGVAQCSEAEIARARSREAPNQGAAELADPSCPAQSRVGAVDVAAGAGPHPFHIAGTAYMAGPYEGAPLSFAIITPAVAGPFDLGTVVVRTPVYLDPETARVRAVSGPLPQVIDGVPADVRKVTLRIDHPDFTRNPTSCGEKRFEGAVTSTLGHIAPLFERFQAGGCGSLPFRPKLSLRLFGPTHRGAHPSLRAVLSASPGEAGIARTVLALPHSEFIDQAHFRTICTRVQFAAEACPAGAVYGHVKAYSPLLDYPLEGPIYLRSSSHELPDIVLALKGPPSQPIEVDLDGRVDSVHGGVRTTFEAIPDAPVSRAVITMQGKQKGLFQNSTGICAATHRATLLMEGQNGKIHNTRPLLEVKCPAGTRHKGHKMRGRHQARRRSRT